MDKSSSLLSYSHLNLTQSAKSQKDLLNSYNLLLLNPIFYTLIILDILVGIF